MPYIQNSTPQALEWLLLVMHFFLGSRSAVYGTLVSWEILRLCNGYVAYILKDKKSTAYMKFIAIFL